MQTRGKPKRAQKETRLLDQIRRENEQRAAKRKAEQQRKEREAFIRKIY